MKTATTLLLYLVLAVLLQQPFQSCCADDAEPKKEKESKKPADELIVSTHHSISIAGKQIKYQATAGKLAMKSDDLKKRANVFFVAYTKETEGGEQRPITYCFNGGPGSSSVWLHLGMLGPKRLRFPDDASLLRPPYHLDDNELSMLDATDLVFIDPVSTGYSRPVEDVRKSEFHGYDEDVHSVGQFIHDYTTRFQRWTSPKFICGESYGGVRAAGLSGHLRDRYNMELNGVIVISGAINFQTLRFSSSNDLPFVLFIPSYAATAWYHKALSKELQAKPVAEVVKMAEQFAYTQYAPALLRGTSLPPRELAKIAKEYARLTGLSPRFVTAARLRVSMSRFGKELLRSRNQTVGRFDGRYRGQDRDSAGERYEFDASGAAIFGPFTAVMNDYVRRDLKFEDERVYEILTGKVQPWSFSRFEGRFVDGSETLRRALSANHHLTLFVAAGYYALATPHFAMDYTLDHLGLSPQRAKNVTIKYYEGGHMMYIHEPSLKQLRKDLLNYYRAAIPN